MRRLVPLFLLTAAFLPTLPAWAGSDASLLAIAAPAPAEKLPDWLAYKTPYKNPGDNPALANMTNTEVISWTQSTVSDAMTLPRDKMNEKLAAIRPFFTDAGWAAYGATLQSLNLVSPVQAGGYNLNTIANGGGTVTAHGVADGAYHWLVTIPVMTSFSQGQGEKTHSTNGAAHNLTVKVGRNAADGGKMVIEAMQINVAALTPPPASP